MKSWKKSFYNVYKKCKEYVCAIYSENYKETVQDHVCLLVLFVFFFNKITMEWKQEEHKSQQNVCWSEQNVCKCP